MPIDCCKEERARPDGTDIIDVHAADMCTTITGYMVVESEMAFKCLDIETTRRNQTALAPSSRSSRLASGSQHNNNVGKH